MPRVWAPAQSYPSLWCQPLTPVKLGHRLYAHTCRPHRTSHRGRQAVGWQPLRPSCWRRPSEQRCPGLSSGDRGHTPAQPRARGKQQLSSKACPLCAARRHAHAPARAKQHHRKPTGGRSTAGAGGGGALWARPGAGGPYRAHRPGVAPGPAAGGGGPGGRAGQGAAQHGGGGGGGRQVGPGGGGGGGGRGGRAGAWRAPSSRGSRGSRSFLPPSGVSPTTASALWKLARRERERERDGERGHTSYTPPTWRDGYI